MSFNVSADAYSRFMGRYSEPLAARFADLLTVQPGQRVLDVGCGPGALTLELVKRLGVEAVAAVDPAAAFVDAVRTRIPGVDAQVAVAEKLPFNDGEFDGAVAQLVVHFMTDPVAGIAEMARVTRPGGRVAACVWDYAGGRGPLSVFWAAVNSLDPGASDESGLAGARAGHLAELFEATGLREVESSEVSVHLDVPSFQDWWEPYTFGVGPAGSYVAKLDERQRAELSARCAELLPEPPFESSSTAWTAVGRV